MELIVIGNKNPCGHGNGGWFTIQTELPLLFAVVIKAIFTFWLENMKQIPIKFMKPKRGKDSCQSVYIENNVGGVAACLSVIHSTDWSADGSNGVLVIDNEADTDNIE